LLSSYQNSKWKPLKLFIPPIHPRQDEREGGNAKTKAIYVYVQLILFAAQ